MSTPLKLKSYQKNVITAVRQNKDLRLIVAMTGSGKSLIAKHLVANRKALVLTYASVVPQLKTYFNNALTISYDKFIMDKYLHGVVKDWVEGGDCVLVLDECQRGKCAVSKTSKILMKLKPFFLDIYMLSACPAPNGLHEYFLASFLSNESLGNNYNKFLFKYTSLNRGQETMPNTGYNRKTYLARGFKQVINSQDELLNKIKSFTIHVPDEEVLQDMPSQEFNIHSYDLEPKQFALYNKTLKDEVLTLDDSSIPLKNKLTVLTKLSQIESGFFYTDDGTHVVSNSKFKSLFELLSIIGEAQCIIFTQFIYERDRILNDLGVAAGRDIEDFKAGRIKYLVGHPKSIGVGVSLEAARYCVFFSHSYSFEDRLQSVGRIYRISQKSKSVVYYDILPNQNTISHTILNVIKAKGDLHEVVKEISKTRVVLAAKRTKVLKKR